ncbi:uncharacterized protein LOC112872987 [Panicum hallii]|uniref:uncharacterized protein LOC112872987 n=1 Tax=Panicum hallii TaxID=206008 RepID=UPI000DF4F044|nr:uncharacterized protein LOC112872987 [Panicum hallii]
MRARADQKSSDFVCVESFVCEAVVVWSGLFVGVVAGIISPSIRVFSGRILFLLKGWLSDWTRARIFQFSLSFSSACGAHATRRIRALWLALISRLGFRRREVAPERAAGEAAGTRTRPIANRARRGGGDGGRRSSAQIICPRVRSATRRNGATTDSLRGRAHQRGCGNSGRTLRPAGTTGGGGLASQTREAGGSGENIAALGVPWLPFEFQQQATSSPSSTASATRSRSARRTYGLDSTDLASMKVVLAGKLCKINGQLLILGLHKYDDGAGPYFFGARE